MHSIPPEAHQHILRYREYEELDIDIMSLSMKYDEYLTQVLVF